MFASILSLFFFFVQAFMSLDQIVYDQTLLAFASMFYDVLVCQIQHVGQKTPSEKTETFVFSLLVPSP